MSCAQATTDPVAFQEWIDEVSHVFAGGLCSDDTLLDCYDAAPDKSHPDVLWLRGLIAGRGLVVPGTLSSTVLRRPPAGVLVAGDAVGGE